jgi:uncharacterized lipoprotein YddW (UPF0748 family)
VTRRTLIGAAWTAAFAWLACFATDARADDLPAPPREFRAAWIATVSNIDWPSRKGLPTDQQKQELKNLLDKAVELHLNAVIFQVRPEADALYASKIEPWSEYLTGTMGQPPKPFYDPLKFAIDEAHRRGLQLHVWLNPYRVRNKGAKTPAAPAHASRTMIESVRRYGSYLWFDPGDPAALDRFNDVLTDILTRYDIDGVHIDDYFYPYQEKGPDGKLIPFPDEDTYEEFGKKGHEKLERDDWRRENCNRLVEQMYETVKKHKPWVLVGISPFGIWRPGHPEGVAGLDSYATLYADAKKWLNEGWVDYFTPQLYWRIEGDQSFPKLLAWWHSEDTKQRHLWPGLGAHNVRRSASVKEARTVWSAEELIKQIEITRQEVPDGPGDVFFSMKCLVDNRDGLADKLKSGVYKQQALIPASPWLGDKQPGEPQVAAKKSAEGATLDLKPGQGEKPWLWVVRVKSGDNWSIQIAPAGQTHSNIAGTNVTEVAVSAVSRLGQEGPVARAQVQP